MPQGIPVSHCPGSNSHILVMSPEPKKLQSSLFWQRVSRSSIHTDFFSVEIKDWIAADL